MVTSSGTYKKLQRSVVTSKVASALDIVTLSDRGAMFAVGAVVQALGVILDDVAFLRNTTQQARVATQKTVAVTQKATFMFDGPLLLH